MRLQIVVYDHSNNISSCRRRSARPPDNLDVLVPLVRKLSLESLRCASPSKPEPISLEIVGVIVLEILVHDSIVVFELLTVVNSDECLSGACGGHPGPPGNDTFKFDNVCAADRLCNGKGGHLLHNAGGR